MDQRAPLCSGRCHLPDRVLRCAGDSRLRRARSAAAVRSRHAGRPGPRQRPIRAGLRDTGRVLRRWPELLDRPSLGRAVAPALAFRQVPAVAGPRRDRCSDATACKSIFIARFIGAVRPFVPAIAGMVHMPLRKLHAAERGRVFPVVGACSSRPAGCWARPTTRWPRSPTGWRWCWAAAGVAVALAWACVLYTWRWFAGHADNLLARALQWTRAHPHLGRYAAALIDPNRPESPSLVVLAVCLLAISWAWFTLLASLLASGGPLALDHSVHEFMWSLRNPLADRLMAAPGDVWAMRRCWAPRRWSRWPTCCGASAGWPRRTGLRRSCSAWC